MKVLKKALAMFFAVMLLLQIGVLAEEEKKRLGITEAEARAHIKRFNRRRSEYYHYYTGLDWGDMRHYDLGINATDLTVDECVDIILGYIDKRFKR